MHFSSKKNRKKKGSAASNSNDTENTSLVPMQVPSPYANISIKDIQMAMDVLSLQKSAKTQEEAMQKPYQFWSTQPVPKMGIIQNNY